ncbi:MAG: methyltransferase domain-containing protein [Bacteroidota bacterium]
MSYQISEQNLERQKLLSVALNKISKKYLKRFPKEPIQKVLDLACGLGETSRMHKGLFPHAEVVGVDMDEKLLDYAKELGEEGIQFKQGDATGLPFPDDHFDLVFTRFLLIHVPDPVAVLKEMKRVCKQGGILLIQEPDMAISGGLYPSHWAFDLLTDAYHKLYADTHIGRKLPRLFEQVGLPTPQVRCDTFLMHRHQQGISKTLTRMTAEAILDNMIEQGVISSEKAPDFISSLKEIEEDPAYSYLTDPVVTIWTKL